MILNAEDLTIQRVNPAYRQALGTRDVTGLPLSEVFSGPDLDHLMKQLKRAVREVQTVRTQPIRVFITDDDKHTGQMVHTAVPIQDEGDENVNRLFLYSEKLV